MSLLAILLMAAQHPAAAAPACTPDHAAMGHCTMAPPPEKPAPEEPATACSAEHAAMGHCTMDPAPPRHEPNAPGCTAEHAAMGHCTLETPPPVPANPAAPCPPEHAAMGHCRPAEAAPPYPMIPDQPVGDAPAPSAPRDDAADRLFGAEAMAGPRARLYAEHGGGRFSRIMVNLAEWRARKGRDGYAWEAEGWFGGDIDRLVVKSEGEGDFGGAVEGAEVQALWSRAIGPYFNLQAGVRQDFGPGPSPTHAVIGFEGLAPYWFEIEGALFLSDKGDAAARLEASYDQRITQRLIAQPMAEIELAFQDVPERAVGGGLSGIELGLRLRYEVAREFAPYVGVAWERKLGRTARIARAAGEKASHPAFVAGVHLWF